MTREQLLHMIGDRVRAHRAARGWTQADLARRSGVSQRFLASVESGEANISIIRLADVCDALACPLSEMVASEGTSKERRMVALVGLRGAGKSTLGPPLSRALGVPFHELDRLVEERAGLALDELFALHGEALYRRLEREVLVRLTEGDAGGVVATGGGIVSDSETFALLRRRCVTVWLKASPEQYMARVVKQGDTRPLRGRPSAMAELRALLAAREPLYRQADLVADTSARGVATTVAELEAAVREAWARG